MKMMSLLSKKSAGKRQNLLLFIHCYFLIGPDSHHGHKNTKNLPHIFLKKSVYLNIFKYKKQSNYICVYIDDPHLRVLLHISLFLGVIQQSKNMSQSHLHIITLVMRADLESEQRFQPGVLACRLCGHFTEETRDATTPSRSAESSGGISPSPCSNYSRVSQEGRRLPGGSKMDQHSWTIKVGKQGSPDYTCGITRVFPARAGPNKYRCHLHYNLPG